MKPLSFSGPMKNAGIIPGGPSMKFAYPYQEKPEPRYWEAVNRNDDSIRAAVLCDVDCGVTEGYTEPELRGSRLPEPKPGPEPMNIETNFQRRFLKYL